VTGQASTILVYTILGFQTIIAIGFHHICWWSSYHKPQEISSSSRRSWRIGSSSRWISMGRRGYGFSPGLFFAPIGLSRSLPFRHHLSLSLSNSLSISLFSQVSRSPISLLISLVSILCIGRGNTKKKEKRE
jgi:hypothetical protein